MWLWILTRSLSAPVGLLWVFCGTPWPTWMWYYDMGICSAKALHFADKYNGEALHFLRNQLKIDVVCMTGNGRITDHF